jgi:hypothetical protein
VKKSAGGLRPPADLNIKKTFSAEATKGQRVAVPQDQKN